MKKLLLLFASILLLGWQINAQTCASPTALTSGTQLTAETTCGTGAQLLNNPCSSWYVTSSASAEAYIYSYTTGAYPENIVIDYTNVGNTYSGVTIVSGTCDDAAAVCLGSFYTGSSTADGQASANLVPAATTIYVYITTWPAPDCVTSYDLLLTATPVTCPAPSAASSNVLSPDSAVLTWTTGGATDWIVEYGVAGFTPGTGTLVSGAAIDTLFGLTPDTDYEWYVRDYCGPGDSSSMVGPESFTTPVTCPAPSLLAGTNIGSDSIVLNWTTGGATDWVLEYGIAGFTPGTGTLVTVNTNPYVLTGLTPSTIYHAYVRDFCGTADTSAYSNVIVFMTNIPELVCGVGNGSNAFVYTEDFETDVTSGPGGSAGTAGPWTQVRTSDPDWTWDGAGGTASSGTGPSGAHSGTGFIYIESTNGNAGDADTITSGTYDLTQISQTARVRFFYHMYGVSTGTLHFEYSVDGGTTWTTGVSITGQQQTSDTQAWREAYVDIPSAVGVSNFMMRFVGVGNGTYQGDMAVDFVRIESCVSCVIPSNITATVVSADSALIDYVAYVGSSATVIEYGPTGFALGVGTVLSTTQDSLFLTGLMGNTTYDVYLFSDCSGSSSDSSTVSAPVSFTTPCVSFVAPYYESFDSLTNTSPYTALPDCWAPQVGPDYWDVTNDVFNTGHSYLPNIGDHTTGSSNYMWIDASSDITVNEMVTGDIDMSALSYPYAGFWFASNNTNNTVNHTIALDAWDGTAWVNITSVSGNFNDWVEVADTVPASIPAVTKFRIYATPDTGTTSSTYFYNDLGVDDFFVVEAPTCPGLMDIVIDSIGTDFMIASWTENGSATEWLVEIVPSGTAPTGVGVSTTNNPHTFTGLSSTTTYDFYIQSFCGVADSSTVFNGPTFNTKSACGDTVGGLTYSLTSTAEVLFSFEGNPGEFVSLEFLAGQVETCCDEVLVYDGLNGTGNIIYGALTGGGLADYSGEGVVESTTGMISLVVNSDVSVTGASSGYTEFEVVIDCYLPPVNEIGVSAILAPESSCGEENTLISVVVENFGYSTIYYVPVVVELSGDVTGVYTMVLDSLPVQSTDTLVLDSISTLAGGSFTVTAFTNLANDEDTSNDTTVVDVVFGSVPATPVVANVTGCEGEMVYVTGTSVGELLWYTSNTASSSFYVGDSLAFTATTDTSFYVGQHETFSDTLTLEMYDSGNDGWSGGSVAVFLNGTPVTGSPFTLAAGGSGEETFYANHNDVLSFIYTSGTWASEPAYNIVDSRGNIIFNDGDGFDSGVNTAPSGGFNQAIVLAGCPSDLVLVEVSVGATYMDSVAISACDAMMINGVSVTTSGMYTDSLTTVLGCDSIVVIDLTITNSSTSTANVCGATSVTLADGTVVSTTGLYTATVANAAGCDSVITYNVTIDAAYEVTQTVQLCSGETLEVGASVYTMSGTYMDTLASAIGCDSIVTSNVTVLPSTDVTIGGVTTVCDNAGVIDLTLNPAGGMLSGTGVTANSFDPAVAGVGNHVLTYTFTDGNGCDANASLEVDVVVCTGIENIEGIETISIYPNPYVSTLNVKFDDAIASDLTITLMDITGRVILSQDYTTVVGTNNISIEVASEVAAGVTMMQIERDGAVYNTTLIKK